MTDRTASGTQTAELEDRLKAGADWVETGLVFTTFARRGAGRKGGQEC